MPANMFNKHNKDDNNFWYSDHHSKDGKTSYRKATFKTPPSESRFTNLSDIPES